MSLFERLALKGYPHNTLVAQHRMCPQISALIKELTYPDLQDAASTASRPPLDGVRDILVFVNHNQPEDSNDAVADRKDMSSTSSKQNEFEARMILKIVRYLIQQGYSTEKMVVLTPYLGQLHKLQQALKNDTDPVLNDTDRAELSRAGLDSGSSKKPKQTLKMSTIG